MTIRYNAEVASATFSGFHKLLLRWRGSIYKLLWKDFLLYVGLYYTFTVIYHVALNEEQRRTFEFIADYCDSRCNMIPVGFVLAFYVARVVDRFWEQFDALPWTMRLATLLTGSLHGQDDVPRMLRRTVMRYVVLCYTITMISVAPSAKKRFPTTQHLVNAGLMTQSELATYTSYSTAGNKYWVPAVWAASLVHRARRDGRVKHDIACNHIINVVASPPPILFSELLPVPEIAAFRRQCERLLCFDWVQVPLVYTQVVTLAVYFYFLCTLIGRQYLGDLEMRGDLYVPVFTFLQYLFYMGWLKVAEELLNPFGEDDDNFEINSLIDSLLKTAYMIVDEAHAVLPEIARDQYWHDLEIQLPYTLATQQTRRDDYTATADNIEVPESKQAFVHVTAVHSSSFMSETAESMHDAQESALPGDSRRHRDSSDVSDDVSDDVEQTADSHTP